MINLPLFSKILRTRSIIIDPININVEVIIIDRVAIDKRPKIVDKKKRIGSWINWGI